MKPESKPAVTAAEKRARVDVARCTESTGKALAGWEKAEKAVRQRTDTLIAASRSPGGERSLPELLGQIQALRHARRECAALLQKAKAEQTKLSTAKTRHEGLTKHLADADVKGKRDLMNQNEELAAELWCFPAAVRESTVSFAAQITPPLGEKAPQRDAPESPSSISPEGAISAMVPLSTMNAAPNQRSDQSCEVSNLTQPAPVNISLARTSGGGVTVKTDTHGITILPDGRGGVVVEAPAKSRLEPIIAAGLAQSGVRFSLRQGRQRR